jgi:hypothetical protein
MSRPTVDSETRRPWAIGVSSAIGWVSVVTNVKHAAASTSRRSAVGERRGIVTRAGRAVAVIRANILGRRGKL